MSTLIFAQNYNDMETTKSTGKYWMYFFISLVVMILMIIFYREFFWVVLPFVVTSFALAMDIM
jgi:predicted RND superfamily exporter protein